MKKMIFALLGLVLSAPLAAQTAQVVPQLGLDKTGTTRRVTVYDPIKAGADKMTPIGSLDAASVFTPANIKTVNGNTITGSGNVSVGTVTSVSAPTIGTSGTDITASIASGTTTPAITINVPTASASNRGALSAANWSTFNGKQAALVSGTNIKTVGGASLLGAGDVGAMTLTGALTSTLATGSPPFVVASTTNVANLNASSLNGATFAAPGSIGAGTPGPGVFTTFSAAPAGSGTESLILGASASATGSRGHAIGYGATANAANAMSIGYAASAAASFSMAIGNSAVANNGGSAVGYASTASGSNSAAFGNSANVLAASGTAIGQGASVAATETGGTAIGKGAAITTGSTGGGENVAIGTDASAAEWRATALGWKAKATAVSSTALGRGAFSAFTHAIAIGRGAWTNATNQIAIGFSGGNVATDIYFESGHTSKYVDWPDGTTVTRTPSLTPIVIHGFDGFDATGSPTSNIAGGDLIFAAGRGTGTATGGSLRLQTAPAGGASNNVKNALVDQLVITATGALQIAGDVQVGKTITAAATTGAQTINKTAGSVNFAAAATSLVVTNSLVTANSVILCTVAANDNMLKSVACVAGAGSFTMHGNAAADAETRVNFLVIN